jgi:hypothetical protein
MAAEATPLDALVAEMLGDIGKLHDAVGQLTGTITDAGANIQVLVNQLEGAGDNYHQAVLSANAHSKKDMLAYVETISKITFAKSADEQHELVQRLIREAVSKEIMALKKALSDSSKYHRIPFKDLWGYLLACCTLTALLGAFIMYGLLHHLGMI